MNNRYSVFDIVMMTGFVFLIAAMAGTIFIKNTELSELFMSLGMWVVVSFFILVLVHGTIRGVPRENIRIPKGLAVLAFGVGGALLALARLANTT